MALISWGCIVATARPIDGSAQTLILRPANSKDQGLAAAEFEHALQEGLHRGYL